MKPAAKVVLYVAFAVVAAVCFGRFRREYAASPARDLGISMGGGVSVTVEDVGREAEGGVAADGASTNGAVMTAGAASVSTNGVSGGMASSAAEVAIAGKGTNSGVPNRAKGRGNMQAFYLSGFVLGMLGLAGLLAWDLSQMVARRAVHGLGADLAPIEGDPEYDAAEEVWASGDHLGAINMLRDFLKRHPSQQHAALRIAEIYEKDLGNHLAAALELEEVLQRRLPREKWGWTAVHLANLYSGRLGQTEKALEVLHRIVEGYPETAAAKKARQRLGLPDPETLAKTAGSVEGEVALTASAPAPAEDDAMPRGFRMKNK